MATVEQRIHRRAMTEMPANLVWIDLEMTGLDPQRDLIIEIATIVTDRDLEVLGEGPVFAINQPEEVLQSMDSWNTRQHTGSGLLERVRASKVTAEMAEQETIDFLSGFVQPGSSPMCGNSICQDRRFLVRYMPKLADFFHYRNLDVSSIKILAQLWAPAIQFSKESSHLALDDIRDSIDELKFYRQHLLKQQ